MDFINEDLRTFDHWTVIVDMKIRNWQRKKLKNCWENPSKIEETMATARSGQLEAAVAMLIINQAQFISAVQRIEGRLANIEALLVRHEQIPQALPEAIRQKVGFKPGR